MESEKNIRIKSVCLIMMYLRANSRARKEMIKTDIKLFLKRKKYRPWLYLQQRNDLLKSKVTGAICIGKPINRTVPTLNADVFVDDQSFINEEDLGID